MALAADLIADRRLRSSKAITESANETAAIRPPHEARLGHHALGLGIVAATKFIEAIAPAPVTLVEREGKQDREPKQACGRQETDDPAHGG
jgi:hypothetical protein